MNRIIILIQASVPKEKIETLVTMILYFKRELHLLNPESFDTIKNCSGVGTQQTLMETIPNDSCFWNEFFFLIFNTDLKLFHLILLK